MPARKEPADEPANEPASRSLENKAFLWLLVVVSIAFVLILLPFYGAVLWGTATALIFAPLNDRIRRSSGGRDSLAAVLTVLIIVSLVILPILVIASLLVKEATGVFERLQSGEISVGRYFQQILEVLPAWLGDLLRRFGLDELVLVQERLATAATKGSQQMAAQALTFGQNTFQILVEFFVMLYLLFFLLRDGVAISRRILRALPLHESHKRNLLEKFTTVMRATVKGNIVVAAIQGTLGGLIFWLLGIHAPLLWGVIMAFLSLLPAIGAAIVWLPVALWLLATGSVWQGVVLIAFGVLVIGLVDNLLRPILVGKDTRMPDYVVLLVTLGGMAIFGINGFVIGPLCAAMFLAAWDLFAAERAGRGA
jgi:predicted PurR-regulated permease PerM